MRRAEQGAEERDMTEEVYVRPLRSLRADDVATAGGKNASLGELLAALERRGIAVPDGFATTASAFRAFLSENRLSERIGAELAVWKSGDRTLSETGRTIRGLFDEAVFPPAIAEEIRQAYRSLSGTYDSEAVDVAVRSSATAEDLPEASFAGQQDTYLNVRGAEAVLDACRRCYASLFTDRAINYRREHGFEDLDVALSVGVQKMVRSDLASSGVAFTLDTETGFPDVVLITAAWGLGETVVQGQVTPDQYTVFKPLLANRDLRPIIGKHLGDKQIKMVYTGTPDATEIVATTAEERETWVLTDDEVLRLARWAIAIEAHYGRPMDIEWAKDGETGELFIVQARPETVHSRRRGGTMRTYRLTETGRKLVSGLAVGQAVAAGPICVLASSSEAHRFPQGALLVTRATDPDWGPIMKQAAGIITDHGGRTSHAAIVSREFGIPALVGTGDATRMLKDVETATLSCAEGEIGHVYEGRLGFEVEEIEIPEAPDTRTRVMLNVASPGAAMRAWQLPCRGVGLARMEYIITDVIKIHPLALVRFEELEDEEAREQIAWLTRHYPDRPAYFVDLLARGIAAIAATQHPHPVIVRMSDFKTNEYAELIGGRQFEPPEENPMLGWRGASRYYSNAYRAGFALECRALRKVREEMGFENVLAMIPFCRTVTEADKVLEVMADEGLRRGEAGLQVYVMAEVPSNVIQAAEFAERFDGFSIGSNDLTQLALGVDRDNGRLAELFDERNETVRELVRTLIVRAHAAGRPVGICGQAPSDYPEFAEFLVEAGIDSISLNPDSVVSVVQNIAAMEARLDGRAESRAPSAEPSAPAKGASDG
jgi:pyruvate,water dikinase